MPKHITLLQSIRSANTSAQTDALQTEFVALERKTEKGHYQYLTPKHLDATTAQLYEERMDKIFATYSSLLRELVGYVRKQSPKTESQTTGEWKAKSTLEAANVAGTVLPMAALVERAHTGSSQVTTASDALLDLADKHVPQTLSPTPDTHTLIDYSPRNELEVVESILFELSAQPSDELENAIDEMKIGDKYELIRGYLSEGHSQALQDVTYTWEVVETLLEARAIRTTIQHAAIQFQEITPRHGYDVPQLVEEAGLSELYERCFDTSYELYSKLQAGGYGSEAELATLLGHRTRWRIRLNAAQLVQAAGAKNASVFIEKLALSASDAHPTLIEVV